MGNDPNHGVNAKTGMGGPPVAMEMVAADASLCVGQNFTKIYPSLSVSRSIVLLKKFLDDGQGLTPWPRAERSYASRMSGRSSGFMPPIASFTGERINADIH
jgi:hypothetical protein